MLSQSELSRENPSNGADDHTPLLNRNTLDKSQHIIQIQILEESDDEGEDKDAAIDLQAISNYDSQSPTVEEICDLLDELEQEQARYSIFPRAKKFVQIFDLEKRICALVINVIEDGLRNYQKLPTHIHIASLSFLATTLGFLTAGLTLVIQNMPEHWNATINYQCRIGISICTVSAFLSIIVPTFYIVYYLDPLTVQLPTILNENTLATIQHVADKFKLAHTNFNAISVLNSFRFYNNSCSTSKAHHAEEAEKDKKNLARKITFMLFSNSKAEGTHLHDVYFKSQLSPEVTQEIFHHLDVMK